MTDAIITHTLAGVPAGSPVCGECHRRKMLLLTTDQHMVQAVGGYCEEFRNDLQFNKNKKIKRCPDCLAAEQRFTDKPPTEPGYYLARKTEFKTWIVFKVWRERGGLTVFETGDEWSHPLSDFDLWSDRPIPMPGGGK